MFKRMAVLLLGASLMGCAWVKLSDEGATVDVVNHDVSTCERLGKTTTKVMDKVMFMQRSDKKQAEELATLARNEAAEMGGNVAVVDGPIKEGRRDYVVYRCD